MIAWKMFDAQRFAHELLLDIHEVAISIVREVRLQPVTRFTRQAVADIVGKNQKIAARIQRGGRDDTALWRRSIRFGSRE
jgi:hypothetical protein